MKGYIGRITGALNFEDLMVQSIAENDLEYDEAARSLKYSLNPDSTTYQISRYLNGRVPVYAGKAVAQTLGELDNEVHTIGFHADDWDFEYVMGVDDKGAPIDLRSQTELRPKNRGFEDFRDRPIAQAEAQTFKAVRDYLDRE